MKNTNCKSLLVSLKALIAAFVIATTFVAPAQRAAAALPDIRVTATDAAFYFQGYLDGLDEVAFLTSNPQHQPAGFSWRGLAYASVNSSTMFPDVLAMRLYFLGRAEAFHRMADSVGETR